jgi:putative ABC transport system permease protein
VKDVLYLAWRYLLFHRVKTLIVVLSITLIAYLPIGLEVLVSRSAEELTARAGSTPLLIGARGSALELVLNSLYFESATPEPIRYGEVERVAQSGHARAIPLHTRFRARGVPIVGTTLDYFSFRGLRVGAGREIAMLGECVLGAKAAVELDAAPGGAVVSSPENVFDLAGVYPLKMPVAGVLEATGGPDDNAVFTDLKTAWVIEGLGHGHEDLSSPAAAGAVLERKEDRIVANASVVHYTEITALNIGSFHFHGDQASYPVTAVIALPRDDKSAAILEGRYQSRDEPCQIVRPRRVMDELLSTVFTIEGYVAAAVVLVGLSTVATAALVFLLSARLRRSEIRTLVKIGGTRGRVASILASEVVIVIVLSLSLAGALTLLTSWFGQAAMRAFIVSP